MADIWVCGQCRSINGANHKQCYKCKVRRTTGEMVHATAAMRTASAPPATRSLADAVRAGARYRPTSLLAVFVVLLVIVATVMTIVQALALNAVVGPKGIRIGDAAAVDWALTSAFLEVGIYAVAVLVWSAWIAVVVGNVPALTARWPSATPIGAFFASIIPFVSFIRPWGVIHSVLGVLSDGRGSSRVLALVWWIAVLATYFAPTAVVYLAGGPRSLSALALAFQVRAYLVVPAALLAIAVVVMVEREQSRAVRRRDQVVLVAQPLAA